jgi:hypothetical protein
LPYTLPKPPYKTDPKTGKIIGAKYISQADLDKKGQYQGEVTEENVEQSKKIMAAFGFPGASTMIDDARAGKNPFGNNASNISLLGASDLVKKTGSSTVGDASKLQAIENKKLAESNFEAERSAIDSLNFENSTKNVLYNYASVNHIWKLACLTPDDINRPDKTYRRFGPSPRLTAIDSSGRSNSQKVRTAAEEKFNISTGYFIDDIEIGSVMAPTSKTRHTNAVNISFEVREPYSMGQLFQTLQVIANKAGYDNYLKAPWLLECTFTGYNSEGVLLRDSKLRRQFPVKLIKTDFEVDDAGSIYKFTCVAHNEQALEDTAQGLKQDFTVSGKDLQEVLQTGINSLATHINTNLLRVKNLQEDQVEVDEYLICFPSDNSSNSLQDAITGISSDKTATSGNMSKKSFTDEDIAEAFDDIKGGFVKDNTNEGASYKQQERIFVESKLGFSIKRGDLSESIKSVLASPGGDCNKIGKSKIKPNEDLSSGNVPFGLSNYAYNTENKLLEKNGIRINPNERTITFNAGTKIQRVIEELILISEYGKDIFKDAQVAPDGMVNWFKIETQVFIIDDKASERVYGRKPYLYVYKVIPYKVHNSHFQMPNSPPKGYDNLEPGRSYEYLYTGKNKDILSFNLEFNNSFYESIQIASMGNEGNDPSSQGSVQDTYETAAGISGSGKQRGGGDGSEAKIENVDLDAQSAGAVAETTAISVARQFNQAIIDASGSLITINMEILGDPYYLADSGVGNYSADYTDQFNVNIDGSVNSSNGEVDFNIRFKTPIDLNPDQGNYLMNNEVEGVSDFDGLYRIVSVNSKFSGNVFTQELVANKRKNQSLSKFQEAESQRKLQLEKKREKLIAEAKATGDPDLIRFAELDLDADGKLQENEALAGGLTSEERTQLATTRANKLIVRKEGEFGNSGTGNEVGTPKKAPEKKEAQTATADDGYPPVAQPKRSGGKGISGNDPYYVYGSRNIRKNNSGGNLT